MVEHIVDIDVDAFGTGRIDQCLEIGFGLGFRMRSGGEGRIGGEVIPDVISVVGIGRMDGAEPQGRHAQGVQVVQLVLDAFEVAHAVAVAVSEGIDQQLIGGGRTLVAVEGGGRRDQRLGIGALLHAYGGRKGAGFHRHSGRPGSTSAVGVHLDGKGAVAAAGSALQMHPALPCRGRPVGIGGDIDKLIAGVFIGKDQLCGTYRKRGFRFFPLRGAGEEGDKARSQREQIAQLFHRQIFIGKRAPDQRRPPENRSDYFTV